MSRGIYDFKKDYQSRNNRAEDEKNDLDPDYNSILAAWRKHFSQLFNVLVVSEVRQTELHTTEPLVPEMNAFEFEMVIEKLKVHQSPGTD